MARLGELLVRERLITLEQLVQAQQAQQRDGGTLAAQLTKIVGAERIVQFLGEQYDVVTLDLAALDIDHDVIRLLPRDIARRHRAIPVSKAGVSLIVAMSDPGNLIAIDDLRFVTGYTIEVAVTSDAAIEDALAKYYAEPRSLSAQLEAVSVPAPAAPVAPADVVDLAQAAEDSPITKLANLVFVHAAKVRARALIRPSDDAAGCVLMKAIGEGAVPQVLEIDGDLHGVFADIAADVGGSAALSSGLLQRVCVMAEALPFASGTRSIVQLRLGGRREIFYRVGVERTLAGFVASVEPQLGGTPWNATVTADWHDARMHAQRAKPERRLDAWTAVVDVAERESLPGPLFDSLVEGAKAIAQVGHAVDALAWCERAAAIVDRDAYTPWVRALGALHEAIAARAAARPTAEINALERARDRLVAGGAVVELGDARMRLALALGRAGRHDDGLAELAAALQDDIACFDEPTTQSALLFAAQARLVQGPESEELVERAWRMGTQLGALREAAWRRWLQGLLAAPLRAAGRARRAEQALLESMTDDAPDGADLRELARVQIDLGRPRDAEATLAKSRKLVARGFVVAPAEAADDLVTEARIREAQGRLDEARVLYARGLAIVWIEEAAIRAGALGQGSER